MDEAYNEYLKSPEWAMVSTECKQRDGYKCRVCGCNNERLNVHHVSYPFDVYDTTVNDVITLCEDCHKLVHQLKKIYKWESTTFDYTKNGHIVFSAKDHVKKRMIAWIVPVLWKKNFLTQQKMGNYLGAIESILDMPDEIHLPVTEVWESIALMKDCIIENPNPQFDRQRRKYKKQAMSRELLES